MTLRCAVCGKECAPRPKDARRARTCSRRCSGRLGLMIRAITDPGAFPNGLQVPRQEKKRRTRKPRPTPRQRPCGPETSNWKGGRCLSSSGYILVNVNRKQRLEHRVVMERHLGRRLKPHEVVHHVDHNRQNNAIENLRLMSQSDHMRLHAAEKVAAMAQTGQPRKALIHGRQSK